MPCIKYQLKIDVGSKTVSLYHLISGENMGKFEDTGIAKDFLEKTPEAQEIKAKINEITSS